MKNLFMLVLSLLAITGCKTSYTWTSSVPERMRTVAVPVFRNESEVTEAGNVVTRQVLREFQREGTFRIARAGDAAIEVQGIVKSATGFGFYGNRRTYSRNSSGDLNMTVSISVVDKANGKVLIDNRIYNGTGHYGSSGDLLTALREASGRAADDVARQVVDDIAAYQW